MKRIILLLLSIFTLPLTGCYDKQEIDSVGYVIAIGIDNADDGYKYTFQYANPIGTFSSGGNEENPTVDNITGTASDFYVAKDLLSDFLGKNTSLVQTKIIVFSTAVSQHAKLFIREREIRSNVAVAYTQGTAEDFISKIKPKLSASASKYYEMLLSENQPVYAPITQLRTLANSAENYWMDCAIPLAAVEGSEIERTGGMSTELTGMAIVKNGNVVGTMSADDAVLLKILKGEGKNMSMRVDSQTFKITGTPHISRRITIEDGIPAISVTVKLELEDDASPEVFEDELTKFLYKTARYYGADIAEFGKYYRALCLTEADWEQVKWGEIYKNSKFNVRCILNV